MSTIEKRDRILWVNTLKGACILLVVLHHSVITTLIPSISYLSAGTIPAKAWHLFNQSVSPLRMPAFFFVSGLLASSSIIQKKWSDVFTKKIANLLYLYLLWGLIQWLFIKKLISEPLGSQLSDSSNSSYAESPAEFIYLLSNAMTSLWYLYALAGYFFLSKLFCKRKYILLAAAITLNYLAGLGYIEGWGILSISQNMIYFLFGAYFNEYLVKTSEFNRRNLVLWAGILALAILNVKIGIGRNIFVCTIAIVASIAICRSLNNYFNMSWLNWLGENTLQIYVIHRIFIEIFGLWFIYLGVDKNLFNVKYYSLAWAASYPAISVVLCTALSILTWKAINHGSGKILFNHPRLIKEKNKSRV